MSGSEEAPAAIHHLVDGDLNYKGFGDWVAENGMTGRGEDYSVLAVFGGQSTGKSTLLNRLFLTGFAEMDSEAGREQTTQGVWMSKPKASDRLVVLDFEGTDSSERGDDQTFEKKLSLFALAMADVLLINLFQNEIGRRAAMSIPLLENVLQINFDIQLQLAQSSTVATGNKKMLMFVIRDYDGRTPVERLTEQLNTVMEGIWERITRPEQHKDDKLTRWFDFKVVALPYFLAPNFSDDVAKLRALFINESDDSYVFKTSDSEWRRSGVMISEVDQYAKSCWEAIVENRDINIPGEKELVARHRSKQVSSVLKEKLQEKVDEVKVKLDAGETVKGLKRDLDGEVASLIARFKDETTHFARYQDVLNEQQAELQEELDEMAHSALEVVYSNICKGIERVMKTKLAEATNRMKENQNYKGTALWDMLESSVSRIQETEIASSLAGFVEQDIIDEHGSRYCNKKMEEVLEAALHDAVAAKAAVIVDIMSARFLFILLHNQDGLALNVKEEGLEKRCPMAYDEAVAALESLMLWRYKGKCSGVGLSAPSFAERGDGEALTLEGGSPPSDLFLVSMDKARAAYSTFCTEIKGKILEARLGLKNRVNLPPWVYIVIAVLGFDEVLWVVSNPMLIISVLLILWLFARKWVHDAYVDGMENGPPMMQAALAVGWPTIKPFLQETPAGDAPKPETSKKNE